MKKLHGTKMQLRWFLKALVGQERLTAPKTRKPTISSPSTTELTHGAL